MTAFALYGLSAEALASTCTAETARRTGPLCKENRRDSVAL